MLKRFMAVLHDYSTLYGGLGFLALECLAWSVFAVPLFWVLPERWARPLGRGVIMAGFRLYIWLLGLTGGMRFDLKALDQLRDQGPLIIAPNHPSLLDAVMILSRLPNLVCILKASLMDNILFGAGSRLARYIRNDSPRNMIRLSVDDLGRGSQLLLFPEGTRTVKKPVNEFRGGIGLISVRAGVPIQTVFIETDTEFLGKNWPLFRRLRLPVNYRLRLGQRFDPPDDVHRFMLKLERYFAEELSPRRNSTADSQPRSSTQ